jgi:hypothetical protein
MGGWVTPGSQGGARFGEFLTTGVDDGIEPAELADTVLAAIRENKLWILTHPESPEAILRRANAIAETGVPPEVRSMGR